MAPEIKAGMSHDFGADTWSLGQIAYRMLVCPDEKHFSPLNSSDQRVNWPQELSEDAQGLILSMVSEDPSQRP